MAAREKESGPLLSKPLDFERHSKITGPVVKEWTEKAKVQMSNRRQKEKTYAFRQYKSGVTKRRLVGIRPLK